MTKSTRRKDEAFVEETARLVLFLAIAYLCFAHPQAISAWINHHVLTISTSPKH